MRFILGFFVILVLLVGGLLVAPSFINWDQYKDKGLAQVKALTGYDINIAGDFKVGFLPAPHVRVGGVSIINSAVSKDPLAKFEDLSVGVALAPLFKKQVQVSDISLVKPMFDLRVDQGGKGNWLSPEVAALLAKKDGATKSSGSSQNIAFDNIEIEDGTFRFFDARKNKETKAENINVDLSAKSLKGPFDGKGTLKFGGQSVAFDVDAGAIDGDALPLRLNAQYGPYGVALKGVAGITAPFDVQGETQIKLSASALPISEDVVIEGILSANDKSAAIKNAKVAIGSSVFNGEALVDLKPLNVKAAFEGSDVIDIAKFLPAPKGGKKADPLVALTEILPKTVTLPQDFTADVALRTGGLVFGQALLKKTNVKFSKAGKAFKASLRADDIPGTGPASVDVDLKFASVSQSKNGAQVYSDPTLSFVVQANTQNTGAMVKALSGQSNIPVVSTSRIGKFYIKGETKPGRFALSDSVVNLDDLKVLLSGSVKQGAAKPVLDAKISSSIDDPYAFAKSMKIDSASWPKNLGAVVIGADLKGTMDDLSADASVNAFGADFIVSGKLDELMSGSALNNLAVRVKHANFAKLLKNVGASAPAYAAMSKPIDAKAVVSVKGKTITLGNIQAKLAGTDMSGALRYDGGAGKPALSGDLKFGSLELKTVKGSAGGKKSSGGSSSGGKWSSAPINTGWLHAANANLNISGERLVYESWDIAKPSLQMVMQNGALDIKNLKGGLFGGQVALVSKASSASTTSPLSVSTEATISNVNISKLATALSGSKKLQGDGTVSLLMDVAGTGASQKALVSSLSGAATLDGKNVVLKGFDLAGVASALLESNKPLSRVQQLVSGASSSGDTSFDTVKGAYKIASGVVTITSMELDGPEAAITSTGNADLPKWYINTTHTIALKDAPDVEPFDVAIKGPLDNPGNTFGKGLFDTYLNEKLGAKIHDLVGDDVGNALSRFGLIPKKKEPKPAPVKQDAANDSGDAAKGESATEPAAGSEAAQPLKQQAPAKSSEEQAQEAIEGVLKGLFQ